MFIPTNAIMYGNDDAFYDARGVTISCIHAIHGQMTD